MRSCPSIAHKQPPTTYLIARMHIEGYILCVESYWCLFILHFQHCRLIVRSTQYVIIRTRIYPMISIYPAFPSYYTHAPNLSSIPLSRLYRTGGYTHGYRSSTGTVRTSVLVSGLQMKGVPWGKFNYFDDSRVAFTRGCFHSRLLSLDLKNNSGIKLSP